MFSFIGVITLLLNLITATALPTSGPANKSTCHAKVFDIPWMLSDITLYMPEVPTASDHSWLRFNYLDVNPRLEMETVCMGTVVNGTVGTNGGYAMCDNDNVAFQMQKGGMLMISRFYRDRCLGQWPYNSAYAFGQNQTTLPPRMKSRQPSAATFQVQEKMEMAITSMS